MSLVQGLTRLGCSQSESDRSPRKRSSLAEVLVLSLLRLFGLVPID